jgi:hypothetical protein
MAVKLTVLSTISYDEGTNPNETAGPCSNCTYALPPLSICAPDYFEKGHFLCHACGKAVDVWTAALQFSGSSRMLRPTSLGASRVDVTVEMTTHTYLEVDLKEHGIPEDAKVLSVVYNSVWNDVGSVYPIEGHGNVPIRKIQGTVLRLFGMPLGEGPIPRKGRVTILVTWVRANDSPAWPYLVTAFESSLVDESAPALVFAQSAVEISMMPVIEVCLKQHVGTNAVREFMRGTLTSDHALNILLPYLCGQSRAPKMPDTVRAALNRLRSKRNKIIHYGVSSESIRAEELTAGLTAAAFGFEFMRYVGPKLMEQRA